MKYLLLYSITLLLISSIWVVSSQEEEIPDLPPIQIEFEKEWLRVWVQSDFPISLDGLELRPIGIAEVSRTPSGDFDELTSRDAQPDACFIYREEDATVSINSCDEDNIGYEENDVFWIKPSGEIANIEVYWHEYFIASCPPDRPCEIRPKKRLLDGDGQTEDFKIDSNPISIEDYEAFRVQYRLPSVNVVFNEMSPENILARPDFINATLYCESKNGQLPSRDELHIAYLDGLFDNFPIPLVGFHEEWTRDIISDTMAYTVIIDPLIEDIEIEERNNGEGDGEGLIAFRCSYTDS